MEQKNNYRPDLGEIEAEMSRLEQKRRGNGHFRVFLIAFALALALGYFVAPRFLKFLAVSGNSMEYTLQAGDYVLCVKTNQVKKGDIVVFRRKGATLLRRVIAIEGDQVTVEDDGSVEVNGELLQEDYISDKGAGIGDAKYPYYIGKNELFVMGDHRGTAVDSRNSTIGTIKTDEIQGCVKLIFWPVYRIRVVE
ncbi:MAG: signal peptidase I [Lachnospiraceae bacterium]|nr:signal peptidase I [Lachnospiraceae bacterium]